MGGGVQDTELLLLIYHKGIGTQCLHLVILFCQSFNFSRDHSQCCHGLIYQSVDLILDPQRSAATMCPSLHHPSCFLDRGRAECPSQRTGWQQPTLSQKIWGRKVRGGLVFTEHPGARYFQKRYPINKQQIFPPFCR